MGVIAPVALRAELFVLPSEANPPLSFEAMKSVADTIVQSVENNNVTQCGGWSAETSIGAPIEYPPKPAADAPVGEARVDFEARIWNKTGGDEWTFSGDPNFPKRTNAQMNTNSGGYANNVYKVPSGKVPFVLGAPGRYGVWNGNVPSGMALRVESGGTLNDGYVFPFTTIGKTTVCELGVTAGYASIWHDGTVQLIPVPPFFGDPNNPDDDLPGGFTTVMFPEDEYSYVPVPYPFIQENPPCHNPGECQAFCSNLNTYTYMDCRYFDDVLAVDPVTGAVAIYPQTDELGNPHPLANQPMIDGNGNPLVIGKKCNAHGWEAKYTCSEEWVNPTPVMEACASSSSSSSDISSSGASSSAGSSSSAPDYPNCRQLCEGSECRCDGPGCVKIPEPPQVGSCPVAWHGEKKYISFYRRHAVTATRETIAEVPQDKLSNITGDVACYGYYAEIDPKIGWMPPMCVIKITTPNLSSLDDLRDSQKGKGRTKPPGVENPDPIIRNPAYAMNKDLWYANLDGGFSLLSEQVFINTHKRDLSSAFLSPDVAVMSGAFQVSRQEPMATMRRVRPADDTVSNQRRWSQTFTRWWNSFLSDAARLTSPPIMRLRIPQSLAPIASNLPLATAIPHHERWESIDVQLRAKDDVLGIIAKALEEFLLLRMETVTIVVPNGAPARYEQAAQQLEEYKVQRLAKGLVGAAAYPPEVDTLIVKLKDHAFRIDQYRQLRTELPTYIAALLTKQKDILIDIHLWLQDNLQRQKAFLEEGNARAVLKDRVRSLQGSHAVMRDESSLKWCRSDHFTTPMYSLVRPWLLGEPFLSGGIPSCDPADGGLPQLCVPWSDRDHFIDLSNFATEKEGAVVPVPRVVMRQVEIPDIPNPDGLVVTAEQLAMPELPPVPTFALSLINVLPSVKKKQPLPRDVPPPEKIDIGKMEEQLGRAAAMLDGMRSTYDTFYQDIDPTNNNQALQCDAWGVSPCSYVETELLQAFVKFGMLGVFLREHQTLLDVESTVKCDRADGACEPMRAERKPPTDGWQIVQPMNQSQNTEALLQALRTTAREQTIDAQGQIRADPVTDFPFFPRVRSEDFYTIFTTPARVQLSPGPAQ